MPSVVKRILDIAGWSLLAIGVAVAALVVLPLQPGFVLPGVDDSFAATLHYAAAHRGEPGTSLISTYGPLGFVHYPMYFPGTFAAMTWWRLAITVFLAAPLAWLGWAATASPWGAALAMAAAIPFLAIDDLRGVLLPTLAVLIELVPRRRPPAALLATVGAGLAVMALIKGTFLVLGIVALVPSALAALRAPRRVPWMVIAALATAVAIWAGLGLGGHDAVAFLDWSLTEITPGYAYAMQIPTRPAFVVQALAASALMGAIAVAVARRAAAPRWGAAAVFGVLLFLGFKIGFVRAEVHMYIAIDLLIVVAVLLGLLWGGPHPGRILGAAVALAALPVWLFAQVLSVGILPVAPYRIPSLREIQSRAESLPNLVDSGLYATTHERYALMISAGQPLPPVEGPVDIYPFQQGIVLAHGLTLRSRPVFQSYMAYTPRLAHANADWLASEQAARSILFRPASLDNRLPAQDDGASWPVLLSRYDPVGPIGVYAALERRATPRAWRLVALSRERATTGETIALPRAARVWARIDVHSAFADSLVGALVAPPTVWVAMTFADGRTRRMRLVPALARDGFLLSPYVGSAADFAALLDSPPPPPERVVTEIRVEMGSPFGGSWSARSLTAEFFDLQID